MGSGEVVEAFPLIEFLVQIYVICVGQELIKLLLIRAVRSLNLSVELGRPGLDVHVPHTQVLDMPMEFGLELMPSVGAYRVDSKGKLLDHIVCEGNGVLLIVPAKKF